MFSKTDDKYRDLDTIMQARLGNDKRPIPPSILSEDMSLQGDIYSEGEVHIDCKLKGDVKCRALVLGNSSVVEGAITADTVKIYGKFSGQIIARSVLLASTSYVTGDITHENIEIELGAYLEGHCHRQNDPIPAEQAPADLLLSDQSAQKEEGNIEAEEGQDNTQSSAINKVKNNGKNKAK